ncbi:MAG: DUF3810 domain-containing protein [Erysipelotrichaceae bacterium]|nr:DUF3810 domain-containing protein [Erysipelotrichaceae bacterium]
MKDRKLVRAAISLFIISGLLRMCATYVNGFADSYATNIYPFFVNTMGRLVSCIPISVGELLVYGIVVGGIVFILYSITKQQFLHSLVVMLFISSLLFMSYTLGCGINYQRTSFKDIVGLEVKPRDKEELVALLEKIVLRLNEGEYETFNVEDIRSAMNTLGEEYTCLSGYYPYPKAVSVPYVLALQGVEGIYCPFTFEANYDGDIPEESLPSTICHELVHLKGFMQEEEASFIAYLACVESNHKGLAYAGNMMAFRYVGNALYDVDRESYREIWNQLKDEVIEDLRAYNQYWEKYEGKVSELQDQMNDVYLKANGQSAGVHSYGMMVDLLLAYEGNNQE